MCGGLISPDPVYHHLTTSQAAEERAGEWVNQADLIITIGSNGYYSYTGQAQIIDINPKNDFFAKKSQVHLAEKADQALQELDQALQK